MPKTPISLNETDQLLLAELDKCCRTPSAQLAEILGKSRQTIEYRIRRLMKLGVIVSFNTNLNPHKMGLQIFKVYLKLRNIPEEKSLLLNRLRSSKSVIWLSTCSGSWDLIIAFIHQDDSEFFRMKNSILSEFANIIVDRGIEKLLDSHSYSKMYFTEEVNPAVSFGGSVFNRTLDAFESNLIYSITNNARMPLSTLAKKLNSSIYQARKTLERLENEGIIIQYRIGVDLSRLGYENYKAIIVYDHYTEEVETKLADYLGQIPQIQYLSRNLGNIELEFVVHNYREYDQIIEDLKRTFPYLIRNVDTVIMFTDEWTPAYGNERVA